MESKIYSREEIEEFYRPGRDWRDGIPHEAIVRQLLAKVDEAAKIEDMLKECVIGHQGDYTVNEENLWAVIEINDGETDSSEHDTLLAALTSLVGGGK